MSSARNFGLMLKSGAVWLILFQLSVSQVVHAQADKRIGPTTSAEVVVGYVKTLTGTAFIRRGNASEVPAKVGDRFGPRTRIKSGAGSEVVLLFADGQTVKLGTDSEVRIDDYRYDPANPKSDRSVFSLVTGTMRVVTGAILTENPAGLRISAGRSVISILSKDIAAFVVQVNGENDERGSSAVIAGQISVRTPHGVIRQVASDQFSRWEPGRVQETALPLAAAPAVIQALVAASRANVQESNLPIDVESASIQAAIAVTQATGNSGAANVSAGPLTGRLNLVTGTVMIRDASGKEIPGRIGDAFGSGAVVTTGADGQVGLVFSEGQYVVMGTDSVFRIGKIQGQAVEGGNPAVDAPFGLLTGRMSFVTWAAPIGNQTALRVAAGDGSIGILSNGIAAFVVEVSSNAKTIGSVAVTAGEISLRTQTGDALKMAADQYTTWQPGSAPGPLRPLADAPGQLQQAFSNTLPSASQAAELAAELALLPATAAGPSDTQALQPQQQSQPAAPEVTASLVLPPVSPGGGRGCVGSPC